MLNHLNKHLLKMHLEFRTNIILNTMLYLLLFSIPLNSSAKSISLIITVILILGTKINRLSMSILLKQAWVKALMIFLTVIVLGCIWSPASWAQQAFVIQKYSKVLWLPLLALGFTDKKIRFWGLHAFIAAMFLTCLVALIKIYWQDDVLSANSGSVFRNYIMTGHMMAFASYLSLYFAVKNRRFSWLYLSLFALFSYEVLFISQGRTGYFIYFILIAVLMIQMLPKKQLWLGGLLIILSGFLLLNLSPKMQQGLVEIKNNVLHYQQGEKNTSVGFRLQFQHFAYQLFKENPLLGCGTGGFVYHFNARNPVPAWGSDLNEPHNQYWMIAAEYGVLGMMVYLGLLITLIINCLQLQEMKAIAIALIIPFLIGCFSDSLLFYSGSGYFFLVLMALCLGENLQKAHIDEYTFLR